MLGMLPHKFCSQRCGLLPISRKQGRGSTLRRTPSSWKFGIKRVLPGCWMPLRERIHFHRESPWATARKQIRHRERRVPSAKPKPATRELPEHHLGPLLRTPRALLLTPGESPLITPEPLLRMTPSTSPMARVCMPQRFLPPAC